VPYVCFNGLSTGSNPAILYPYVARPKHGAWSK
jgi:hypothetical protein